MSLRSPRNIQEQLFLEFAEEYGPDSGSKFLRAMRFDNESKLAMVRKVMRLKHCREELAQQYLDYHRDREIQAITIFELLWRNRP